MAKKSTRTLLLLRHARAVSKDADVSDHERPLKKRGKRDASRMGALAREQGLLPDLILSSTADRARTTAELFAESAGCKDRIRPTPELYEAGLENFVHVLQHVPEDVASVMLVGHNPGFEDFLSTLTGTPCKFPKAGLAHLTLPIQHWQQFGSDTRGTLVKLWKPKELEESEAEPSGS